MSSARSTSEREANAWIERAIARCARGEILAAIAAWRTAIERGASPDVVVRARPLFERVEGRLTPSAPREPPPKATPESPAWERAWAADYAAARALAAREPDEASSIGLLGVVDVLERRTEEGLARLERALAVSTREDLVLHRVRALVHLGRLDEARRAVDVLVDGEGFARRAVIALLDARTNGNAVQLGAWLREVTASDTYLNGFFHVELPAALGDPAWSRAIDSPRALASLLDALLDRMAGNLGPSPTLATEDSNGRRGFAYLTLPRTTRNEAISVLYALPDLGAARAEAALDALVARGPRAIHGRTYRGELRLWLGRWRDAWRDFAEADRVEPVRWAEIGMVAVLTLTGHVRAAQRMAVLAEERFSPIRGGTLPVYRGALRRRVGELDGAVDDLRAALAVKPTRLGARIELCLALRGVGAREESIDHAATLARDAGPLLVDAAEALELPWRADPSLLVSNAVLERALIGMRGNRSSVIVTWIDRTGSLRVLSPADALAREASALAARWRRL